MVYGKLGLLWVVSDYRLETERGQPIMPRGWNPNSSPTGCLGWYGKDGGRGGTFQGHHSFLYFLYGVSGAKQFEAEDRSRPRNT